MIDVESYHVGASLALRLAGQGHEVTIATPSETVAAWCNWTLEGPRLRAQLHAVGVAMRQRGDRGGDPARRRALATARTEAPPFDVETDAVVLVTQRLSQRGALPRARRGPDALAARGIEAVYRTGDCVAPRWLVDTVFDGHRLAREIDSADPARLSADRCASASFRHSAAAHGAHIRHRRRAQRQVGSRAATGRASGYAGRC